MIDLQRSQQIFDEVNNYILELDKDPKALGPAYLQERIATCRNYLNRVSLWITEITHEEWVVAREMQAIQAAYQLEFDHLLANDDHVKRLANIEDRKSTVAYMLRDTQRKLNDLRLRQGDVKAVNKVVTHRHRELQSTMMEIRKQQSLISAELQTGAFYGDERTQAGKPRGSVVEELDAEDLEALLSGSDPPPKEPVPEPKEPVPEPKESISEAKEAPPEEPSLSLSEEADLGKLVESLPPVKEDAALIGDFLGPSEQSSKPLAGQETEEDLTDFLATL